MSSDINDNEDEEEKEDDNVFRLEKEEDDTFNDSDENTKNSLEANIKTDEYENKDSFKVTNDSSKTGKIKGKFLQPISFKLFYAQSWFRQTNTI